MQQSNKTKVMNTTTTKTNFISIEDFQWDGKTRSIYVNGFRFEKFSNNKKTQIKSWYDPRLKTRVKDVLINVQSSDVYCDSLLNRNSKLYFAQTMDNQILLWMDERKYTIPIKEVFENNPDAMTAWIYRFEITTDGDRSIEDAYQIPTTTDYSWNMKSYLGRERSMIGFYTDEDEITENMENMHWIDTDTGLRYESSDLFSFSMLGGYFTTYNKREGNYAFYVPAYDDGERIQGSVWRTVNRKIVGPLKFYGMKDQENIIRRMICLYMVKTEDGKYDVYSSYTNQSVLDGVEPADNPDDIMINMHPSSIICATSITPGRTRVIALIKKMSGGKLEPFRVDIIPNETEELEDRHIEKDSVENRQMFRTNIMDMFELKRLLLKNKFDETMTIKELMEKLDDEIFVKGNRKDICRMLY